MHTELMYDAVPEGVPYIPGDARIVAGYIDGSYQSYPLLVRRFHGKARLVSIGVFLGHLADFTDVEKGNPVNTPELVRADYEHRKRNGVWCPGFYGDLDHMENVIIPGLTGIPESEFRLWLADWDGDLHAIPAGFVAKKGQRIRYAANQAENTAHYDITVVDTERFFKPHDHAPKAKRDHRITRSKVKRALAHHKKTVGSVAGGGIGVGLSTLLSRVAHVHLTVTEASGISTILGYLAAYFAPNSYFGKRP